MYKHKIKSASVTSILASLLICCFTGYYLFRSGANLIIENGSEEVLSELSVIATGYEVYLGQLAPGEIKRVKFRDYSDSAWRIRGIWQKGGHLDLSLGYITHGVCFDDRVKIFKYKRPVFESKMWYLFPP